MKQRIFAMILVIAMIMGTFSGYAMAEEPQGDGVVIKCTIIDRMVP